MENCKLFTKSIHCWSETRLNTIIATYRTQGATYISAVSNEQQYPVLRQDLYGRSTSQGTEAMNNANTGVRNSDAETGFIIALEADQKRFVDGNILCNYRR